ncbi:MAG: hypothetical protein ACYC7D_05965 [Nitrososphaerales archaeon]
MVFNWIYILIIGAIATLALSEVLITYQKHQMRKQFLKELDTETKGKTSSP